MFNKNDVSAEIAASMERQLVSHSIEKQAEQINKFAKALDYLNSVAEIFDELGLRGEAEATTTLLEVIAAKKSKKKSKSKSKSKSKKKPVRKTRKSDPATKGLTSEKMEDNLKEKGWVFNADDNSADDPYDFHHSAFDLEDEDDHHFDDDSYVRDPFEKDEHEQDLARRFHELLDEDEDRDLDDEFGFEDEHNADEHKRHRTILPPPIPREDPDDMRDDFLHQLEMHRALKPQKPSDSWRALTQLTVPTERPGKRYRRPEE